MSWVAPFSGGALCSTVLDLVRFEAALEQHRLFGDDLLRAMRSPTKLSDGISIDYGFATRLGRLGKHRLLGHTGTGGGFNNALERFPDDDLTIVVLTNTDGGMPGLRIATRIATVMLGLREEPVLDLDVPFAESYAGTFESDEGQVVNVVHGSRLAFHESGSTEEVPFRYQGDETFAVAPGVMVRFLKKDGRPQWGASYVGGMFMDAAMRVK
jgi:CubicO group peptidase (beta-lactamase class C family)